MSRLLNCPLCSGQDSFPAIKIEKIEISRCRRCGLLFRTDDFGSTSKWYEESYYHKKPEKDAQWGGCGDYASDSQRLIKSFGEHMADIELRKKPGSLLDVGCATGTLLEAARRRGWQVYGIDISEYAADFARREFGLDVRVGSLEQMSFPESSFDVITAFEFIEHVLNPIDALSKMRKWIKPDGLLVLTTPNAGSWSARRHPEKFDGFLEWRHLTFFTKKTMEILLRVSGFVPVAIKSDISIITSDSLSKLGVRQASKFRDAVNRFAPSLKQSIRSFAGRLFGGPAMKVYAKPIS
jgi:2-polyprenyl-3-methyl-5-hydroxy-6-metoxy-1,4-benzoquinol methylase